ncbi:2,3-diphosphoglycerate-dependent phosphoglycerate mutase [Coprobacter sp.]
MHKLILLRHGESVWNNENRFTGWMDVDLSPKGVEEAKHAGTLLKKYDISYDLCYTSFLKRAIKTQFIAAEKIDLLWIPVIKSWRLNERHYGALQGLNKKETALEYGDEQVKTWRRSFDVRPPQVSFEDPRFPGFDPRYAHLDPAILPHGESLEDTISRVLPYWEVEIAPQIISGKTILIAAHGNSLRALIMHLDQLSPEEVVGVEVPTGTPLIYELDDQLRSVKHYYLE